MPRYENSKMINENELMSLLLDLESDMVERKESFSSPDRLSQAICAFANNLSNNKKAGYLIVGARDNGSPSGLKVTDQLLLSLGELRSNGQIQPIPHINVQKCILNNNDYAVVEVMPSDYPPVRYKGTTWVRVGPSRSIASQQEERVLTEKRISNARSYDAHIANEATLSDLSIPLFSAYRQGAISAETIQENHRSTEEQLASLRFYDTRKNCATNAGILLFGTNPRYYLPGAYIQYLNISGTKLTDDIIDQREISGDLLSILRELETQIRVNIQNTLRPNTLLTESRVADYPEKAIRELLMNAIMHRDYQSNAPIKFYWFLDRIEIHSSGGPYGNVTMETLETASDYRNPIIAEAMKTLGYVERYGSGIQKAQKSLQDNGNPRATFECDGSVFLSIIKRKLQ
jgi:ATP-dependent DNA helicase RecG